VTPLALAAQTPDIPSSLAARHLLAGREHQAAGSLPEAIAAYRRGFDAAAIEGRGPDLVAELHTKLGNACMLGASLDLAAESYRAALTLAPHLAACWCNLATINLRTGNAQDAVTLYLQALKLNPSHWPSRSNLAEALIATRQHLVAKALLIELAEERPQDAQVRQRLDKVCHQLNEPQAALAHFRQAVALDANDAESLYWNWRHQPDAWRS